MISISFFQIAIEKIRSIVKGKNVMSVNFKMFTKSRNDLCSHDFQYLVLFKG